MRRRGSGIVRTAARTAAIAGTATAASEVVHRKMNAGNQPPAQAPAAEPEQAAMPQQTTTPAPSGGMSQDQINQLKEIAQLRDQGVLTDAEFQDQKQKILGG